MLQIGPEGGSPRHLQLPRSFGALFCRLISVLGIVFTVGFVPLRGRAWLTAQSDGHGVAAHCGKYVEECQSSGRVCGEWFNNGEGPSHFWMN